MSQYIIKVFLVVISGALYTATSFAQVALEQPQRLEIEMGDDDNYFIVAPAGVEGLVLFRETSDSDKTGNFKWEYLKVDTALNHQWTRNLYLDKDYPVIGFEYRPHTFYSLFYKRYSGNTMPFRLIEMDLDTGDTLQYDIRNLAPIELSEFTVIGNYAFFIGKINSRASVFTYNLKEKRIKVLQGLFKPQSEILDITNDEEKRVYSLVMSERTFDRRYTISVRTYDYEGNLLYTVTLKPEKDYSLLDAKSSLWGKDGSLVISGTYASKRNAYSEGLFVASISEKGEKLSYYPFASLENFYVYYKSKKARRLKEKYIRKTKKGRTVKTSYRSKVNSLVEKDGEYLVLTEFYYPQSSPNQHQYFHPSFGFQTTPYRHLMQSQRLLSYKYTHSLLVSFDKSGKLKWDNALELKDISTTTIRRLSHFEKAQDSVSLFYLHDNILHGKIFKGTESEGQRKKFNLRLMYEGDKGNGGDVWEGGVDKWYDNYFYVYGVHRIENNSDLNIRRRRRVFYVNKLVFK